MRGNITKRGTHSFRIKLELPRGQDGSRRYHVETIRGSRQDAERELAKQISAVHGGTYVAQAKTTVADYLNNWLEGLHGLAAKTKERYGQLIDAQINPHIGHIVLQKLKPVDVKNWHNTLLKEGSKDGGPLSAQTVAHCHRCLHTALRAAVVSELVSRNVVGVVRPPKIETREVEIQKSPP